MQSRVHRDKIIHQPVFSVMNYSAKAFMTFSEYAFVLFRRENVTFGTVDMCMRCYLSVMYQ